MDMKLGNKPLYVGAIVGAVLLGGIVALGEFVFPNFGKMRTEIRQLKNQVADLDAKVQQGQAAERKLPQFREEVRRLELELDKLLRILPSKRQTEELLKRIEALASAGDFDLKRFTPGKTVSKEFYLEWPITVSVVGTYHNLALFFDKLSKFSRIINVENLNINSLAKVPGGRTINSSFVAKTFIYQEPGTEPSVPKAKKGKEDKKGKGAKKTAEPAEGGGGV